MKSVLIPRSLSAEIEDHSYSWPKNKERGGILMGHRKAEALHVTGWTFPGAWDTGTATRFFRSHRSHRLRALREWIKSGMTVDWIGEWHTHPGFSATPSLVDQHSWQKIGKRSKKIMVYMIFSDSEIYVGLQMPGGLPACRLRELERDAKFVLYG